MWNNHHNKEYYSKQNKLYTRQMKKKTRKIPNNNNIIFHPFNKLTTNTFLISPQKITTKCSVNVVYLQQEKLYSCVINVAKKQPNNCIHSIFFPSLFITHSLFCVFFAFAFLPVISTPNFHHFDSLIHLVFQCAISNTFTQFSVLLFPIFFL